MYTHTPIPEFSDVHTHMPIPEFSDVHTHAGTRCALTILILGCTLIPEFYDSATHKMLIPV